MKACTIVVLILCFAAISNGAVNVSYTWNDLGGGLWAFPVHLVATSAADAVTAVDLTFDVGPLNQVKAFTVLDTPTLTNAALLSAGDQTKDTHFLLADADIIPVTAPAETTGSLSGVFGIQPSAVKVDLPLAQIVMAKGHYTHLLGKVSNAAGTEFFIDEFIPYPVEPGTMALFGLGALLLRRRR